MTWKGFCYKIIFHKETLMPKKIEQVYQFKITLKGIRPPIWRRIVVPKNYTFWDLHVAIQDAMGWLDSHLHMFEIMNPRKAALENIGIPTDDLDDFLKVIPGWTRKISSYFSSKNQKARYIYDFGDDWEHDIRLEKILPCEKGVTYPVCVKGKRACPPEDCGGIWGYQDFLEAILNPLHEEHKETLEWAGGKFDAEAFDPNEVYFEDPDERRKMAFE